MSIRLYFFLTAHKDSNITLVEMEKNLRSLNSKISYKRNY
jgi:hypothetical protein